MVVNEKDYVQTHENCVFIVGDNKYSLHYFKNE
jgi:hypothetical protein